MIEVPKLYTLNRFAEKPLEAFVNFPKRRLIKSVGNYFQETEGGFKDCIDHHELLGRQLGISNDNEQAKLLAAATREMLIDIIANLENDIELECHIDFDHNQPDFLRAAGNSEQARFRIFEGISVARDKFSMEEEGNSLSHQIARLARIIDISKPEQTITAGVLLGLCIARGDAHTEQMEKFEPDYQLMLLNDNEPPF